MKASCIVLTFIILGMRGTAKGEDESPAALPSEGFALASFPATVPLSEKEQEASREEAGKPFSLTLEEAINTALRRNRQIAGAADNVTGSQYSLISAKSDYELKITPAGSAGVSGESGEDTYDIQSIGFEISRKFPTGTRIYVSPSVTRTDESYETGIDSYLTQPLLRGLSIEYNLSGIKAAEYGERTSLRSLYLTRVNIMLQAVQNVYDVIRLKEVFRLNEESARRVEGYAEAARVKEKIGLASPIDVYRAEIQLNQATDNLNFARESYQDSLDNLKILLALPVEKDLAVTAPLEYKLIDLDPEKAIGIALSNRVEVSQAKDNLSETRRGSRVAKHNILPQLDLELNYRRFGEDKKFGRSARFDEESWGVGLSASGDLWRTGEKAQYRQSLLSVRGAKRSLASLLDDIQREVQRELRNLRKAAKSIEIQKNQIHQAEGKLELARLKFSHGMANNFDVIESERELLQAQSQLLGAVTGYITSTYRLKATLGTLLEKPEEWST